MYFKLEYLPSSKDEKIEVNCRGKVGVLFKKIKTGTRWEFENRI